MPDHLHILVRGGHARHPLLPLQPFASTVSPEPRGTGPVWALARLGGVASARVLGRCLGLDVSRRELRRRLRLKGLDHLGGGFIALESLGLRALDDWYQAQPRPRPSAEQIARMLPWGDQEAVEDWLESVLGVDVRDRPGTHGAARQ